MKPTVHDVMVMTGAITTLLGTVFVLNDIANRGADKESEHRRELEKLRKKENERGR